MTKERLKGIGWCLLWFGIIVVGLCAESIIDKLI